MLSYQKKMHQVCVCVCVPDGCFSCPYGDVYFSLLLQVKLMLVPACLLNFSE